MKEFELSKYDFKFLDKLFENALKNGSGDLLGYSRCESLKDKFAKAHTAILFIEEE